MIVLAAPWTRAESEARLHLTPQQSGFDFTLTGNTGTGPWVLQHSNDGTTWEEIQFMDEAAGTPVLELDTRLLATPASRTGFFRATQLPQDDTLHRRFLNERAKWRLSGITNYQFDLSQNSGPVSWRGIVNVANDTVTSSTTIDFQPPFLLPPEIPTVEELFQRIADAIAADAHEITVTWDRDTGAPLTAYIDLDEAIADEESGWSILRIGDLPDPTLQIEARPDGLAFHLAGTAGTTPWLLQHSADGKNWEDLQFWDPGTEGGEPPELVVPWSVLSAADANGGLFRAIQLAADDPFRRQFIAERTKWRLTGIDSYQFELRQSFGMVQWTGLITVTNGEVSSFTTIDIWPPGFEPSVVPTIDDLFARLADAIAANAHQITASWDKATGAPLTGYIDREQFLVDEESGWTILSFTPAP